MIKYEDIESILSEKLGEKDGVNVFLSYVLFKSGSSCFIVTRTDDRGSIIDYKVACDASEMFH